MTHTIDQEHFYKCQVRKIFFHFQFVLTRTQHAGSNTRLPRELLLENSKSKKGHNYGDKLRLTCPTSMVPLLIVNS